MDALSDSAAKALCGLAQKALEEKGVDPILAAAFAERACRPLASRVIRRGGRAAVATGKKATRKASAYSKKYGRAFKKVAKKYKKKNGAWVKDGFKKAQKAAHREAKK